jgi:hypothetical protein
MNEVITVTKVEDNRVIFSGSSYFVSLLIQKFPDVPYVGKKYTLILGHTYHDAKVILFDGQDDKY